MNIETKRVAGIEDAIDAMRYPMDSWEKSDSFVDLFDGFVVGEKDMELSKKLQKAGPEHCKHLRQVMVWAVITAPREWWIQYSTYRYGVESVSQSTMHTLMRRPLVADDFEHDCINDDYMNYMLESINTSMEVYRAETDPEAKKEIWRSIIEALPQSYLQKRRVMMSYAALRNIVRQREGHKLNEWKTFIDWCHTLPESWMIFDKENDNELD